tara:strand:+ start:27846 stop:28187 length:342 start_codon:yes stop_codon:yes gene_type:complete
MGFRSTICSDHYAGVLPEWFKEKYKDRLLFPNGTLIVSKSEWKYYDNELFEDYQKALKEIDFWLKNRLSEFEVNIAVLHEDGKISKVVILPDSIKYYWTQVNPYFYKENVWMQ